MVCMCHKLLINEFCSHTNSTYSTYRRWLVIYLRWRYTVTVPTLMCPDNNLVLMCYVLVNEVNNEIHNLLQITRVFIGSARPYSSITWQTCWCPTMYSCDQWIKKNFHHHYWTMQAANHPRLAYYNTNNSMFNINEPWTDRFVLPMATEKALFPHWTLYIVRHQHVCRVLEEYGCVYPVKPLYTSRQTYASQYTYLNAKCTSLFMTKLHRSWRSRFWVRVKSCYFIQAQTLPSVETLQCICS